VEVTEVIGEQTVIDCVWQRDMEKLLEAGQNGPSIRTIAECRVR